MSTAIDQEEHTSTALANDRFARGAAATVRIVFAFLWIQNVRWKTPPDFEALAAFTGFAVEHPVFAPYSAVVESVILPRIEVFGWLVIVTEAAIGAFLLVGLLTRLWALLAVAQSTVIFLTVGLTPEEWPWSYYLMMAVALLLAAVAAGRAWGLDAIWRPHWTASDSRGARWLARAS
jgi:thiosulfate dehydrogenase [quinone] large subunit